MSKETTQKKPLSQKQRAAIRKKKKQKRMMLLAAEILVLLLLAIVLFVVVKLSRIEKDSSFSQDNIKVNEGISKESQEIMEGYTTIALFGVDNTSGSSMDKGSHSDVIMIASINNDTHEVKLVSVYRDSYLDIGNNTFKKCNQAYANGGPEQAINMLNTNLDLNITDYVTVNFNAVVECVDLLDGVEVTITDEEAVLMQGYINEVYWTTKLSSDVRKKYDYEKDEQELIEKYYKAEYLSEGGTYTLDGVQACAYSRIRYTAGDDYKRTERQRTVLAAMIAKAQKSNLETLNSLINEMFGDIKTSYSNADMLALAAKMFDYSLGETAGFPFEKNSTSLGSKGSVVVPCDLVSNVTQLHVFLYNDTDYEPTETVKSNSAQIISETGFHQGDGF